MTAQTAWMGKGAFHRAGDQTEGLSHAVPNIRLLRAMTGHERLSTRFGYQLALISKYDSIQHEELLGQPVTVQLELPNYQTRYFNSRPYPTGRRHRKQLILSHRNPDCLLHRHGWPIA